MPVRIYDIAKKLGLESKEVLAKAKELGITAAKVPSSSLDKITAEYLEEQFGGRKPVAHAPVIAEPIVVITAPVEATPASSVEPVEPDAPEVIPLSEAAHAPVHPFAPVEALPNLPAEEKESVEIESSISP